MRKIVLSGVATLSLVAIGFAPTVPVTTRMIMQADAEGSGADVRANRSFADAEGAGADVRTTTLADAAPSDPDSTTG